MSNQDIARILYEIAQYLDMDDVPFKPRAYEKAAEVINALEISVGEIYKGGGLRDLEKISGVGVSIAEKIEELLKTGKMQYYASLKKKIPVDLNSLSRVEGLGSKGIKKLYKTLGIKNLGDLEKAARAGKIRRIEGFGEKSEQNILKSIAFVQKSGGRHVLWFLMPLVVSLEERLQNVKGVEQVTVAGSTRRKKETIGDVDILVSSREPKRVMDAFVSFQEVVRVIVHGETKSSVKLHNGLNVDVRVIPPESYGAALNYFTGSKDHNVALREIAIAKGYKLNEYGLYKRFAKREAQIAGRTEEEIYKKLGMGYIEPEMRENAGEIALAQRHKLPKLINYGDVRGDLQVQTNWTDGAHSISEMAHAAIDAGLEYIAITDHTKRLAMTHGLDEKRIKEQWKEIDHVNSQLTTHNSQLKVLKGTECDILKDGSLDLPDSVLSKCDVVGVSVHSYFNLDRKTQTERIIRAMHNPHADILFHPTGRIINKREPYNVDMEAIIKVAKETGTVLEIDAYPDRSDLKDEHIRMCVAAGVKMVIDSDAHAANHFSFLEYGIAQARRGWAKKSDIVNAWDAEKMKKMLK